MMAKHHAIFGLLAADAIVAIGTEHAAALSVIGAASAAIVGSVLPDLDEPASTVAHAIPWLSTLVSRTIAAVIHHRDGPSHSLGTAVIVGGAVGLAATWLDARIVIGALGGIFAFRAALGPRMRFVGMAVVGKLWWLFLGAWVGIAAVWGSSGLAIGVGLAIGIAVHVLTDWPTGHGVALAWPLQRVRHGPGWLATGSLTEAVIAGVALVVALLWPLAMGVQVLTLFLAMHAEWGSTLWPHWIAFWRSVNNL